MRRRTLIFGLVGLLALSFSGLSRVEARHGEVIRIRNPVVILPGSPEFVIPPTPCGQLFQVAAGDTLSFPVEARDPDPEQDVALSFTIDPPAAPPGPRLEPPEPRSNPVQATLIWTPTAADAAADEFRILLVAVDPTGLARKCKVFVTVVLGPVPPEVLQEKVVAEVAVETFMRRQVEEPLPELGGRHRVVKDVPTGTGRETFFIGPIEVDLPGPGDIVRIEKRVLVEGASAVEGGVIVNAALEKVIVFQVEGEPEPRRIPVRREFAGFIPVPGARPGDQVRVLEAGVAAETERRLPRP